MGHPSFSVSELVDSSSYQDFRRILDRSARAIEYVNTRRSGMFDEATPDGLDELGLSNRPPPGLLRRAAYRWHSLFRTRNSTHLEQSTQSLNNQACDGDRTIITVVMFKGR